MVIKEFSEKGILGYKVSAKDRDAIQEIQHDAVLGKFDILLVSMFDRLGRRDDETPFIVEWFVKNGVEVWSAMEGQQRFDNHVDKLMNYIRYWQASGESIKTSVRVKTRMEQLTKDGCFTGGIVPFGYKLQKQGRINKKNQEVNDFVIDEDAAEIVRFIFYKYVNEGYGAQRISHYLLENGIRRADGSMIPNTTIVRMILFGMKTTHFTPEKRFITISSKMASHNPATLTSCASSMFPPFPRHRRSCASGRSRMATCR